MLFTMTNKERLWSWAIYVGLDAKGLVHGVPTAGYAGTLEEAKEKFSTALTEWSRTTVVTWRPRGRRAGALLRYEGWSVGLAGANHLQPDF